MARFLNLPTFDPDFMRPKRMSFDTPGSGIGGGKNGYGEAISIDFSGGGLVTGAYEECVIFGDSVDDDQRHEYINMLGARLNGGFRFVNVPIVNDRMGPFPIIDGIRKPIIKGIPHSDMSPFSDTSGYSQKTVWARLLDSAPLNAGRLKLRIYGAGRDLRLSDWFSIYHDQNGQASKGWRAWRYWESVKLKEGTVTVGGTKTAYADYSLAITPPLREATAAGTAVEVVRPKCVMKFPDGFSLPFAYEANGQARPTLRFIEAF